MEKMDQYARYHEEVVEALEAAGHPLLGLHIARERGSQLEYAGLRYPERRKIVADGFSFTALPEDEVLAAWDALWRSSPNGDVLFAVLDYYRPIVRKRVRPEFWPVMRHWIARVDNWAHADELGGLYSWLLAAQEDEVYPQLVEWNRSGELWERRISIVSLIHYTGKNAVFLPPERVLPLVANCIDDHRYYMQQATGWVLREMGHVYPDEIAEFIEANAATMGPRAFRRAIEQRSAVERARLKVLRDAALNG
jgi:3-methyladenine DNA glycosylase AlkD